MKISLAQMEGVACEEEVEVKGTIIKGEDRIMEVNVEGEDGIEGLMGGGREGEGDEGRGDGL